MGRILTSWIRSTRCNWHLHHNHLPSRFRESVRLGAGSNEQDEMDEEEGAVESK
jgi:hypothetical protein